MVVKFILEGRLFQCIPVKTTPLQFHGQCVLNDAVSPSGFVTSFLCRSHLMKLATSIYKKPFFFSFLLWMSLVPWFAMVFTALCVLLCSILITARISYRPFFLKAMGSLHTSLHVIFQRASLLTNIYLAQRSVFKNTTSNIHNVNEKIHLSCSQWTFTHS